MVTVQVLVRLISLFLVFSFCVNVVPYVNGREGKLLCMRNVISLLFLLCNNIWVHVSSYTNTTPEASRSVLLACQPVFIFTSIATWPNAYFRFHSADVPKEPSLVLILKWGGELTPAGRIQAEELGRIFRCMYPGKFSCVRTHQYVNFNVCTIFGVKVVKDGKNMVHKAWACWGTRSRNIKFENFLYHIALYNRSIDCTQHFAMIWKSMHPMRDECKWQQPLSLKVCWHLKVNWRRFLCKWLKVPTLTDC